MLPQLPGMTPAEAQTREITSQFVQQHLRPTVDQDDAEGRFRKELFFELAKLKRHAFTHEPRFGGQGGDHRSYYAFLEELGRGSLSFSVSVGVTNLVQGALAQFGSESQKALYLKPLAQGKWLGAFSLSEPQAGSDASALRLAARPVAGGYSLEGTKLWCSNAGDADLFLVFARTGENKTRDISAFLVPRQCEGFRVGKMERKLGLRASTLAELIFEGCFVPEAQRLGAEGEGLAVALSQLDAGRISIAAAGLAATSEAIETVYRYFHASGLTCPESEQQRFADFAARWSALRALIWVAADSRDRGEPVGYLASALKLLSSDLAVEATQEAVQAMGLEGYRTGSGVERLLRDSKALQIVEGTNQIQRLVLARKLDESTP